MKKDTEWLKSWFSDKKIYYRGKYILSKINQLDEQETLSLKWIDMNKEPMYINDTMDYYVESKRLENLLVLKQEEVTEEQFLEYAKENNWIVGTPEQMFNFQKSIEELNEQKEPETVASVIANFYKSLERLREVLAIEVEELEE